MEIIRALYFQLQFLIYFSLRTIVLTSGGRMFGNFNPYLYVWYFQERSGDLKGGTSESSNKKHLRLSYKIY